MNPQSAIRNPQSIRRLLVRGVNWLGDAVMTTPALLRLRERFPGAHIALLTPAKLRDLWCRHPAIDETISFEPEDGLISVGRKLQAGNFDLALVLPNSPRSALEAWLAKIPQRIGYARPWRNWLLTQAIPTRPGHVQMHKRSTEEIRRLVAADVGRRQESDGRALTSAATTQTAAAHHIHEYLHLAAALGTNPAPLPPQLVVAPEEIAAVAEKFDLTGAVANGLPLLGLAPGAEYGPAKRWPAERFVEVAAQVQQHHGPCRWLMLGGPADAALAERVAAGIRYEIERPPASCVIPPDQAALNLAGRTSLRELCVLLKLCRVLLTNDSGPMHVAAALGTPVVAPFGSTSPELTGPGLPGDPRHRLLKSVVPCSPCFRRECPIDFRCMNGISVESVVEAVSGVAAG